MSQPFAPIARQNLSDHLARRIAELIRQGPYRPGERLPSITAMARQFGVGQPSVREALKKLETVGAVEIRHGSGVYVGEESEGALVLTNPLESPRATHRLLLDLLDARIPLELRTAELAAVNATAEELAAMRAQLREAEQHLNEDQTLNRTNMGFHRQIARASRNLVLDQLLRVVGNLFREEQHLILRIFGNRVQDHGDHLLILEALEARDPALAASRMRTHLEGVRETIMAWDGTGEPSPAPGVEA